MADVTFKTRVQNSQSKQIFVQAMPFALEASKNWYVGGIPRIPTETINTSKVYPRTTGTINKVSIYTHSDIASGSSDASISVYVRVNNTTDYLVSTLSVATAERIFYNNSMNSGTGISITETDYFEIKIVTGAYTTDPQGFGLSGIVFLD